PPHGLRRRRPRIEDRDHMRAGGRRHASTMPPHSDSAPPTHRVHKPSSSDRTLRYATGTASVADVRSCRFECTRLSRSRRSQNACPSSSPGGPAATAGRPVAAAPTQHGRYQECRRSAATAVAVLARALHGAGTAPDAARGTPSVAGGRLALGPACRPVLEGLRQLLECLFGVIGGIGIAGGVAHRCLLVLLRTGLLAADLE